MEEKARLEILERHLAAANKELHEKGLKLFVFSAASLMSLEAANTFDSLRGRLPTGG